MSKTAEQYITVSVNVDSIRVRANSMSASELVAGLYDGIKPSLSRSSEVDAQKMIEESCFTVVRGE